MSELSRVADDHERAAKRYAAELIDALGGLPQSYDRAVDYIAIAYLEGGSHQLKYARDIIRDGTPPTLRSVS